MAYPNVLPSDRATIVAAISPQSKDAAVSSGWVSMEQYAWIQAIVAVGALGASGTVDAKIEQAQDATGTGAKDISGKKITQLSDTAEDDDQQAVINVYADELDVDGGFTHVRLTITPATAASQIAGLILGHDGRYGPQAADSVAEVVF